MNMKNIIILLCVLLSVGLVVAEAPNGLAFLKINPDVRSSGMGETGTYAGDHLALTGNPANLAGASQRLLSFAHHQWIQDVNINYLQIHFPGDWVDIGFSALSTGVNDIEVRSTPSPEPQSYIDSRDLAFGLTAAKVLYDKFRIGATVKYIQEHIFYEDTGGLAVDFGGIYRLSERLNLGASVLHLGKMSAFLDERPQLPMTVNFGGSYNWDAGKAGKLTFAAGGNLLREEDLRWNAGCEWTPVEMISLRGGYLIDYDERGLTAGLGLHWNNLRFDYAYVPFSNDLGNAQRYGFSVGF